MYRRFTIFSGGVGLLDRCVRLFMVKRVYLIPIMDWKQWQKISIAL